MKFVSSRTSQDSNLGQMQWASPRPPRLMQSSVCLSFLLSASASVCLSFRRSVCPSFFPSVCFSSFSAYFFLSLFPSFFRPVFRFSVVRFFLSFCLFSSYISSDASFCLSTFLCVCRYVLMCYLSASLSFSQSLFRFVGDVFFVSCF